MSSNSNKPDTSLEYRNEIVIENETMVLIPCGLRDYQKIAELANTYRIGSYWAPLLITTPPNKNTNRPPVKIEY